MITHEQTPLEGKGEEAEFCSKVIFCEYSNLVSKCLFYLKKTEKGLINLGYAAFEEFKGSNRLEDRFPAEKLKQCLLE